MFSHSIVVSPELLKEVEKRLKNHPEMGYTPREEFVEDAIGSKLIFHEEGNSSKKLPQRSRNI